MFAGHYTSSFVAKAASPRTPLWLLLLAAQFVDVIWGMMILGGIEHARLDPSLHSNPLDLYDMPWTHSLAGSIGWSLLAFVACRRLLALDVRESALVSAVVVSHWFLDFAVHRPDLTIAGGNTRFGLALWNHPLVAWELEMILIAGSIALAMRACVRSEASRRAWLGLAVGLLVLQTAVSFGPLPPSLSAMVTTGLAVYAGVAAAGAAVDAASSGQRA